MSLFNPPSFDANQAANAQAGYNQKAAQQTQQLNMVNQLTPTGSLTYRADPSAPGGYTAVTQYTPQQQALLDQLQRSKANVGGAAESLTGSFGSMYGQPPNIDPSSLTNKMMGWGQQYMQPIFDQQQSNLDAKLQNQGITPGSQAYNNAQNLQSRNVNNAYQNLFLNAEPTAFNQAMQEYNLPLQTAYGLAGAGAPVGAQSVGTIATPTEQIQAPNYMQGAEYATNLQQQQYQNAMQGAGMLAGAAMGGIGGIPGMFGGGLTAGGWGMGNMFMGGGSPSGYG
jgi:hypothetical protein